MTGWWSYGPPQLDRFMAEDFSALVIYRRMVFYRGEIHLLH